MIFTEELIAALRADAEKAKDLTQDQALEILRRIGCVK